MSYTVSSTVNPDTGDNLIQIIFNKDLIIDLATDVTLILNGRSVGRGGGANWNINGSGKIYSLTANSTIYNGMISAKMVTNHFRLNRYVEYAVPPYVEIPLYQVILDFLLIITT